LKCRKVQNIEHGLKHLVPRPASGFCPFQAQASRKLRLLKGPKEFREIRKDHK